MKILYLYIGTVLFFLLSLAVTIVVSLLTKPVSADRLAGITWPTRNQAVMDVNGQLADERKPFVRQAVLPGEEETEFTKGQVSDSAAESGEESERHGLVDDERDDGDETQTMECLGHELSPAATRWALRGSVICLLLLLATVSLVFR